MDHTYSWEPDASAQPREPRRFYAETGHAVSGAFLGFLEHYGLSVCGFPISDVIVEDGVPCQYFQHLALQQVPSGGVQLKPLGEAWLAHVQELGRAERADRIPQTREVDMIAALPRHPSRSYATRPMADIRYVVIHHTGADKDVSLQAIAKEHVEANGWPGIGYHYVVESDGTVNRSQDLTTVSHHSRQFNPVAVGVAIIGDLSETLPTNAQIGGAADLLADLLASLGLPISAIRGHREMVPTPCPGETFMSVWKPRLVREVERRLSGDLDEASSEPDREPVVPVVAPEQAVVGDLFALDANDASLPATPEAPADATERAADPTGVATDPTDVAPDPAAPAADATERAADPTDVAADPTDVAPDPAAPAADATERAADPPGP